MPRLLVKPGTPEERVIPLPDGSLTLGRSPACGASIPDDSISGTHCQIVSRDGVIIVKDLGSTNGTFLDGEPITEAAVTPGRRLRFGNVEAELIADPPKAPARPALRVNLAEAAPPPPSTTATYVPDEYSEAVEAPAPCGSHPDSFARYYCPQCQKNFCELCVSRRPGGERTGMYCRKCGLECVALNVAMMVPHDRYSDFFAALPGMFTFPFKGGGIALLICGALVLGFLDVLKMFGGPFSIGLHVVYWGYLFSFMQRLVQTAAQGSDEWANWSIVTDFFQDILQPFLQILVVSIVCFAPAGILAFTWRIDLMSPAGADPARLAIYGAALIAGAIYYPMSILAVSMFDTVAAMNPLVVIPAMFRAAKEYVTVLVLMGVVAGVKLGGEFAAAQLKIPFLPTFVTALLGLYFLIVQMRMLGLMYYARRADLGWFSR